MALETRSGRGGEEELWFFEDLYSDVRQGLKVREVLVPEMKTKFQKLMILDTYRFGKVLVLDGVVQTTVMDEHVYHEAMAHVPLFSHRCPKKVLIVGGGDGGVLREVLKHEGVEHVDLVEIDNVVTEVSEEYLTEICGEALSDPRALVCFEDAAEFIKRKTGEYDVIIVDSSDPIGPAQVLFKTGFYLDIRNALKDDGIVIRQTGSSFFQPDEMPASYWQMKAVFESVQPFLISVPTYIGGPFTLTAASRDCMQSFTPRDFSRLDGLKWYSEHMHEVSKVLPGLLRESIEKTEYGRELVVDLYGCDYDKISSTEYVKEFGREICKVIGMQPYGEPIAPDFGNGKSKTAGLSLVQPTIDPTVVQLIETSAITAHYSKHWRTAHINIFTCASLDTDKAIDFLLDYFGASKAIYYLVRRGTFTNHEASIPLQEKNR